MSDEIDPPRRCPLTVSRVHRLNAAALPDLLAIRHAGRMAAARVIDPPGEYRRTAITICRSDHEPPPPQVVDAQMQALLEYLDAAWTREDAAWLGGLALWRINWIHPYRDGNGRTARAACRDLVQARRLQTNPRAFANAFDRILIADRAAYYEALRRADMAYAEKQNLDVAARAMRGLVNACILLTDDALTRPRH